MTPGTATLGLLLGLGAVLLLAPWLWPRADIRGTGATGASGRRGAVPWLAERLAAAGLGRLRVGSFVTASALAAIVAGAALFAVTGIVALGVATGLVALAAPPALLGWRSATRRRNLARIWPDVVDHLVASIRSGLSLPDSVVALSSAGPAALRESFEHFERNYRITGNFAGCLDQLKQRLADPTADRILETLRMAREVGGSELPSVLRSLSATLRQEVAVRAELEARQSWVTNAAKLGAAAPWLVLLLLSSRPEAAAAYNTPSGAVLILTGVGVSLLAYRLMLALGRLPTERRWFR